MTRTLPALLIIVLTACALPTHAQDREDPYGSLKRAELAIAHSMVDDMLATTLAKTMETTIDAMLEDAPLDPPLRTRFNNAFGARLPKLIAAMQDWFAQAIADEFTYVELLYPGAVDPQRWSSLSQGSRSVGIDMGLQFIVEVIEDVCVQTQKSGFCERARDLISDEDRLDALRDRVG